MEAGNGGALISLIEFHFWQGVVHRFLTRTDSCCPAFLLVSACEERGSCLGVYSITHVTVAMIHKSFVPQTHATSFPLSVEDMPTTSTHRFLALSFPTPFSSLPAPKPPPPHLMPHISSCPIYLTPQMLSCLRCPIPGKLQTPAPSPEP